MKKVYVIILLLLQSLAGFCQIRPFQVNKAGQFVYKENAKYNLKYIDVEQGLSSSFVQSIAEDSTGNMWFGTWGGGLMKYDGITIDIYNNYSNLPNNIVRSVIFNKNTLYAMFDKKGIYQIKNRQLEPLVITSDTLSVSSQFLVGNELWFTTADSVLYKVNKANLYENKTQILGLPRTKIYQIKQQDSGEIWLAANIGLIKYVDGDIKVLNSASGYPFNSVKSFCKNESGQMLLSDGVEVYYVDENNKYSILKYKNNSLNRVLTILTDKNDNFWLRTYSNGVFRWNGKSFLHLNKDNGLTNDEIWKIYCDRQNNIWIAPRAGGICRFDGDYITHYTMADGLLGRVVWSLAKNKQTQTYYFGTINGGITEYDGNQFTPFAHNSKLPHQSIRALYMDTKQNLWIGTLAGVMCYNSDKKLLDYTADTVLKNGTIFRFVEDKNNVLWICKKDGITCFDKGKFYQPFKTKEYNTIENVGSVLFDKDNNTWIASDEGLLCLNSKEEKLYTAFTDSVKIDGICLYEDTKKRIWVGSRNGIYMKDGAKTYHFTQLNGLSSDIVWSLSEDKNGSIWAGTEFGLSKIDELKGGFKIEIISLAEGFTGGDCTQNGLLVDENNMFWWGTSKKLTVLDPAKLEKLPTAPVLQMKGILLNYKPLDWTNNLELKYYDNNLTFEVSAIDWGYETKLKYQFSLKGFKDEWYPVTTENKITFSNLSPGNYTLQVIAISNSGLKSSVLNYPFVIEPAFWQTLWFKILLLVTIIFSVVLTVNLRLRSLRENKKMLERIIKERTSEIIHQKEIVENKNFEITKSIQYAQKIQSAILPSEDIFKHILTNSFILFKPKDIVSGDFYWLSDRKDYVYYATADCTGHGVPGGFMSMLGTALLNEIIDERKVEKCGDILTLMREKIMQALKQAGDSESKDGMDMVLIRIDKNTLEMQYAAANNSLYIVSNMQSAISNEYCLLKTADCQLFELPCDKMPVGVYHSEVKPFQTFTCQLQRGDIIYTYTDGYADQFGGEKGKKYTYKRLREKLLYISQVPLVNQKDILDNEFENWKGNNEQVDDVCLIGVKI